MKKHASKDYNLRDINDGVFAMRSTLVIFTEIMRYFLLSCISREICKVDIYFHSHLKA